MNHKINLNFKGKLIIHLLSYVEGNLGELRPNASDLFIWARYYIDLTDDTVANHQLVLLSLVLALLHAVLLVDLLLDHLGRGVLANGLEQEDVD